MRRFIDLAKPLMEAPIEDFTTIGDFDKNSSYRKPVDRKLLTHPKAVAKIKAQWSKTKFPFNMYFVNLPEAREHNEVGFVPPQWLETNMPKTFAEVAIDPNAINIIYTNNRADQHVPMTGWILAHRLSHAMDRDHSYRNGSQGKGPQIWDVNNLRDEVLRVMGTILRDGYGIARAPTSQREWGSGRSEDWRYGSGLATINWDVVYRRFYESIGAMRSARERKIRNEFEFLHELFAQYIITGAVKFRPLPTHFEYRVGKSNRYAGFKGPANDREYYNTMLEDLADTIYYTFENILGSVVGKVFVM